MSNRKPENLHFAEQVNAIHALYERLISTPQRVDIGSSTQLSSMYEGEKPPLALREYQVHYPKSLIQAYQIACKVYDQQFMQLVARQKTSQSDYQYAPSTLAFQVDGPAYPEEFLRQAKFMNPEVLAQFIIQRAFEFESNIAAYSLNSRLWPEGTTNQTWHATLENVRRKTGKQIAVLAGSEQKLNEMLVYEIGATRDQLPPPEVIRSLTGFDAFLGPNDLIHLYEQYGSSFCPYVFFGRTSRPKSWLREPATQVDEGFLSDPTILSYVRAHALTHNFDNPNLSLNSPDVLLDTKEALVMTGSAYRISDPNSMYSPTFMKYLADNGIDERKLLTGSLTQSEAQKLGKLFENFDCTQLLSPSLSAHLQARGVSSRLVASGDQLVRAKPLRQHYGIYGHETGQINRAKFLNTVMKQIRTRGEYVLQPEFANLHIIDKAEESHIAIDRVFLVRGADGELHPMESCRSLMPATSFEGKRNNVHEGSQTKCARISI